MGFNFQKKTSRSMIMVKPTIDTKIITIGIVSGGTEEIIESDLAKGKNIK
ncbi:hypothetical protein LPTSP3_g18830 [Leptospira kobayashii]|uniref:Uncharacterized protein n=1 Tax=Leptospira kobayashii TaxID=1917830 RepID=A0ABN6KDE4_9LEPT|nr:hypothetical protein LPTSP3_g18830 [Leptospira kobayashii]